MGEANLNFWAYGRILIQGVGLESPAFLTNSNLISLFAMNDDGIKCKKMCK